MSSVVICCDMSCLFSRACYHLFLYFMLYYSFSSVSIYSPSLLPSSHLCLLFVCVSVSVQVERALELVRSGLKAVIEINKLEDISLNRRWLELTDRLTSPTSSTADIYRSLTLGLDRGLDM